ncbi:hypothetical protein VKT23_017506 [Stygiomarasmius scandens]|uniref:Uncharacterized protein n=1 Tax=Marasmiellus scandens TaxID=2682957 RepID=A0ABR1IU65_9AGAR
MATPTLFKGEGDDNENAAVFLKQTKLQLNQLELSEPKMVLTFGDYLYPGSEAEEWYTEVMEGEDPPATWQQLVKKFEERWPRVIQVKKEPAEYVTELMAYKLEPEELLKKVEKGGVTMDTRQGSHRLERAGQTGKDLEKRITYPRCSQEPAENTSRKGRHKTQQLGVIHKGNRESGY